MKSLVKNVLLASLFFSITVAFGINPAIGDTVVINEIQLDFELINSSSPDPNAYPILLLHGGLTDSDSWKAKGSDVDMRTLLSDEGFNVITLDSRGHGRSRGELGPITYELMADDVAAFINYLIDDNIISDDKVNILGWSDGGVITLNMCKTYAGLVNAALIIGTNISPEGFSEEPLLTGNDLLDRMLNGLGFADLMEMPNLYNLYADLGMGPDWIATKKEVDPGHSNMYWSKSFKTFRSTIYDMWKTPCYLPKEPDETCMETLQKIETPIFVIAGENDGTISFAHTFELFANLQVGSPRTQAYIFPGLGHAVPWEAPYELATFATDWFGVDNPK